MYCWPLACVSLPDFESQDRLCTLKGAEQDTFLLVWKLDGEHCIWPAGQSELSYIDKMQRNLFLTYFSADLRINLLIHATA